MKTDSLSQRAPAGDSRSGGALVTIPPALPADETARDGGWIFPPRRILAAVDFGEAAARAVGIAGAIAERYDASLTAIHADIIEAPAYVTHEQAAAVERQRHRARLAAERELAQFVRQRTPRRARTTFVEESPATAIIEGSRAADLVVMGTHGRRGPSRWWLGSVAERVVREADVPVLVVRADDPASPPEAVFRRPVMVAGRLTFEGGASRYAAGLADAFGGSVAERAAACEEDVVRERGATLLVMAGDRATSGRWFGSAVERLIRSCALPMLVVPGRG